MPAASLALVKAHGTGNDFLVLLDPDDRAAHVGPGLSAALCDRRTGIGADGFIRAVPAGVAGAAGAAGGDWFMDHWNADGSSALMCGNGARVMAEVLRAAGFVADAVDLTTRSGLRRARRGPDGWTVDMGAVGVGVADGSAGDAAPGDAEVDTLVSAPGLAGGPRPGLRVDVGNPHVVVALTGPDELAALDLSVAPAVLPAREGGVNVEFAAVLGHEAGAEGGAGRLTMRVHERGAGETLSCGTGAVAAAAAASVWAGSAAPPAWHVQVPGGVLRVDLQGSRAALTGPVEVVARVEVDAAWVAAAAAGAPQAPGALTRSTR